MSDTLPKATDRSIVCNIRGCLMASGGHMPCLSALGCVDRTLEVMRRDKYEDPDRK